MADTDNQETGTELKNELFYQSDDSAEDTGDSATEEEDEDTAAEEDEEGEEEEQEEGEDDQEEEKEAGQLTIDGKSATQDQIDELEQGSLRLSDYTGKTQALSVQVKELNTLTETLEAKLADVEAIIDEEELAIEELDLDVEDPAEILKRQRAVKKKKTKVDAARKKLTEAKTKADHSKAVSEGQEMQRIIPDWFNKNGTASKKQEEDTRIIEKYLRKKGYPAGYMATITKAREFEQLLGSSKFDALQKKKQGIKTKIKKATNVKGKKQAANKAATSTSDGAKMNKLFYG